MKKKSEENEQKNKDHGAFLKETRESKGISLEAVHEATKIPMDALKAIEEGYKIRTLSPFYLKAFKKKYAKYLEIDITEVIEDYRQEEIPPPIESKEEDFEFNHFVAWWGKHFTVQRKQQLIILVSALIAFFVLFKIVVFLTHRKPSQRVTKIDKKQDANQAKVDAPLPEVKLPPPKPAQTQPVAQPSAKPSSVRPNVVSKRNVVLTIRARKNSWLRVISDGAIVFQSTLKEGSIETWEADERIEISGKNISSLEFELNGKTIGTLGRQDRRAKTVVVTKDGLSVDK